MKCSTVVALFLGAILSSHSGADELDPRDEAQHLALAKLRQDYARHGIWDSAFKHFKLSADDCVELLDGDGTFRDLRPKEREFRAAGKYATASHASQSSVEGVSAQAWLRIRRIAESYRGLEAKDFALIDVRLFRAIRHYAAWETERPDGSFRFHTSCFAVPKSAVGTYFALLAVMDAAETNAIVDPVIIGAVADLKRVAMQSWTQPKRNDATDADPVRIDRFRKHVWWVGGNGLAYRPVFATSVMLERPDMIEVLADVAAGSLSPVSYRTLDTAFWIEGMTVDGLGWGHGRQSLVFGYPFDGTLAGLSILEKLQGTPWQRPLSPTSIDTLINLLRGSTWVWFDDHAPPMLNRMNMRFRDFSKRNGHRGRLLAQRLLDDFGDDLTAEQRDELEWYVEASQPGRRFTDRPPAPDRYTGVRYFWNNDLLVAKHADWQLLFNMSSSRTHGLESAHSQAAGFNLFTTDGQRMIQRDGTSHTRALAASNLTQLPGVTAREEVRPLQPLTHWTGFPSKHDFAGGVAHGDVGCAGFIFEKVDGITRRTTDANNPAMYGIVAHKSTFVFGDTIVALGSGIRDTQFELHGGRVHTSVEQTLWRQNIVVSSGKSSLELRADHDRVEASVEEGVYDGHGATSRFFHHDGLTYHILPEQTHGRVILHESDRQADWPRLSQANAPSPEMPAVEKIFHLSIDHGENPQNASYGYLVRYAPQTHRIPPGSQPRVLANTPQVQAVISPSGDTLQAVVFDADTRLQAQGWTVEVSRPAVLLVKIDATGGEVIAADPLQNAEPDALTVTLTCSVLKEPRRATVTVPLPAGANAGRQTIVKFTFD